MIKYVKYLISVMLIAVVYGGWAIYNENVNLQSQLGRKIQNNFHSLWSTNKMLANELAVAAITGDPEYAKVLLFNINRNSYSINRNWDWNLIELFEGDDLLGIYENMGTLSEGLLNKLPSQQLSQQEREQIKLAYQYLRTIDDGLTEIWSLGLNEHDWVDIINYPHVKKIIHNTTNNLSRLPKIQVKGAPRKDIEEIKKFTGEKVSLEQATQVVKKFIGPELAEKYDFALGGEGSDEFGNTYYSIFPQVKGTNRLAEDVEFDVSVQGGHLIEYNKGQGNFEKEAKYDNPAIDVVKAEEIALGYLKRWRPEIAMELIQTQRSDELVYFIFAAKSGSIPVYQDAVQISISLDKGELINFDALLFYRSYRPNRQIGVPVLTKDEARKKILPSVEVTDEGLAVILNRERLEVLAYKFNTKKEPKLTIFINAITGNEDSIGILVSE